VATAREIQQQHDEVLTHIDRLHRLSHGDARGLPHARSRTLVRQHLQALHAVLERHFAAEEEGGYMAEMLRNRPDLSSRADRIATQHGEILAAFENTLAMAPHATLIALEDTVGELLHLLGEHEAAERRLVQDAVLQDLGVGD
jgi:hypothetical protein